MDQRELSDLLSDLPLGAVRYSSTIGSTNEDARQWLSAGAPDLALVAAGEQTAGRGQGGRSWQSPAGASLSFSLVLRENLEVRPALIPRLTALGALAVCDALADMHLPAKIKWPNDVLLAGRKAAGVLTEAQWSGSHLEGVVLGIGVNVTPTAVAQAEAREGLLRYPAVSVEEIAGQPVDRWALLASILRCLLRRRASLDQPVFLQAWEQVLAFKGETVVLIQQTSSDSTPIEFEGRLDGLENDGALRLITPAGTSRIFHAGEVRLQPLSPRSPARSGEPIIAQEE